MSQQELRAAITAQVVQALKNDQPPWRMCWQGDENLGMPTNVVSKKTYKGCNTMVLQLAAKQRGYTSKWWGTERQWARLGGEIKPSPDYIRDDDWGVGIYMYSPNRRFLRRRCKVYNIEQVNGDFARLRTWFKNYEEDIIFLKAEQIILATGADIRFGGQKAWYYRPPNDYIVIPTMEQFKSPRYYYTALFHELAHFAECRVGWRHEGWYALGELVAEMAGIFIAYKAGVPPTDSWENHYTYLAHWLKMLEEDEDAIFVAAAQASKVTDFILSFYEGEQPQAA